MTTKTATTSHVILPVADEAVVEKMKARAEAKKERRIVLPPLMAIL